VMDLASGQQRGDLDAYCQAVLAGYLGNTA
jgi:hypothetical protein